MLGELWATLLDAVRCGDLRGSTGELATWKAGANVANVARRAVNQGPELGAIGHKNSARWRNNPQQSATIVNTLA